MKEQHKIGSEIDVGAAERAIKAPQNKEGG